MSDVLRQIDNLDISLFDAIPSQTSVQDRRSLLAVQRSTARKHQEFVYLEIGSHLGGSIQPYLVDHRCKKIISIDPRPFQQPDDRSPGYIATYENNSTEHMLKLLGEIDPPALSKIEYFDDDASEIDISKAHFRANVAFIDGEHTTKKVISDFQFCNKILFEDGTVLFHDFEIIFPAILEILRILKRQKREFIPLKLYGSVFGIFFDPNKIYSDPFFSEIYARNKGFLITYRMIWVLKKFLPRPLMNLFRNIHRFIGIDITLTKGLPNK